MGVLLAAAFSQALALAALAAPAALRGEEVHCVRDRAHLVRFDVAGEPNDGSSMKGIERALISVEPSPLHAERCAGGLGATPSGVKQFCYGVNQNDTCDGAKEVLPIKDGFECKDCFVSASADAFYKLNYTMEGLNSVTLGLRGIDFRASAGVHKHLDKPGKLDGSMLLPGSDQSVTLIDALVGCPVCVKVTIKVGAPTTLYYDLSYSGTADFVAGASLDLKLEDNIVHYDSEMGWAHQTKEDPQVLVKPVLSATAEAEAEMKLGVKTSLQIDVDGIIWYHLNLDPMLPMSLKFDSGFGPFGHAKVCINGGAAFVMDQEANLDWNLIAWHVQRHWGPAQLYTWSKQGVVHECKEVGAPANSSLLVV